MNTVNQVAKGNPASAQPMTGLSKRAQKLLSPVRNGFNTPIEAPGINHARQALRKSSI
jgi:hypothetical protein